MFKNIIKNKFKIYAIFVGIILFVFTLVRAKNTGITYDEAWTYLNYTNVSNPFLCFKYLIDGNCLANNHILNTFIISLFDFLFKTNYNELIIRLPNLIMYILYLFFAYKLAIKYKYKFLAFNLLVFNYGVHEFFGLARGYGMAAGFVLIGIYFLKKYDEKQNDFKNLNLTYLVLLIACYANTVSLLCFASVIIYTFIILLKNKNVFEYIKKSWYYLLLIIPSTLIIINYHFMVTKEELPVYGQEKLGINLFPDIFNTYGFNGFSNIASVLFAIVLLIYILYLKKKILNYKGYILPIIYIIIFILLTFMTKQKFMVGRLLIPFTPLLFYGIIELVELADNKMLKSIVFIITVVPIVTFMFNLNLNGTRNWKDDYRVKKMCYEAYRKKNYDFVPKEYKLHPSTDFYTRQINKKFNYRIDISENNNDN